MLIGEVTIADSGGVSGIAVDARPTGPGAAVTVPGGFTSSASVPDVMARLQVSRHTVYQLIRSRRLASVTIGRCRRIPVDALEAYLSTLREAA
jgi:excisionase family DNA binding protein